MFDIQSDLTISLGTNKKQELIINKCAYLFTTGIDPIQDDLRNPVKVESLTHSPD